MRYLGGNRLALLTNGEQYFPALVAALDAASDEIFLETYIFAADETGSLVADALARAAARGVRVRLLIDGFGAHDFAPRFLAMLEQAGARVLVYRPEVARWSARRSRWRRMHRKLASIDARVAFVGGINVIDDFDTPDPAPPRYDYAVRIEGPLVARVRAEAAKLWSLVSWARLGRRGPGLRAREEVLAAARRIADGQRAALLVRDNLRHRRDIEKAYLSHIGHARQEIVIACAYFFPGRRIRRALMAAAARGVRVVLLLQGRVEYPILHYAPHALYDTLLEAGVEIREYHLSLLHAKVAVFDRKRASVGSSNIDPFSLLLAREANVFVNDRAFAGELRDSIERAMNSGARVLPIQQWKQRPWWQRLRIRISYGIARLLISFAGYEKFR
jgi:cardiolipin synthase